MSARIQDKVYAKTYRVIKLFPDPNRLIVRASHHKVAMMADGKCPDLTMMALQLLYLLKLNGGNQKDGYYFIAVYLPCPRPSTSTSYLC